eukprot:362174-Chlamydomonas_euryale.AAC.3
MLCAFSSVLLRFMPAAACALIRNKASVHCLTCALSCLTQASHRRLGMNPHPVSRAWRDASAHPTQCEQCEQSRLKHAILLGQFTDVTVQSNAMWCFALMPNVAASLWSSCRRCRRRRWCQHAFRKEVVWKMPVPASACHQAGQGSGVGIQFGRTSWEPSHAHAQVWTAEARDGMAGCQARNVSPPSPAAPDFLVPLRLPSALHTSCNRSTLGICTTFFTHTAHKRRAPLPCGEAKLAELERNEARVNHVEEDLPSEGLHVAAGKRVMGASGAWGVLEAGGKGGGPPGLPFGIRLSNRPDAEPPANRDLNPRWTYRLLRASQPAGIYHALANGHARNAHRLSSHARKAQCPSTLRLRNCPAPIDG